MQQRIVWGLAAGIGLAACATDSGSIKTSDLEIEFDVLVTDAPEPVTTFKAYITKGLSDIELSDGDELHAVTDKGDDVTLSGDGHLAGFYEAQLPGKSDGTEFTFELRRASGDDALATTVTIPGPLAVVEPLTGKTYKADENIELAWTNPVTAGSASMYVYAAPCKGVSLDTAEPKAIADSGTLSVRAGDLLIGAPAADGTCVELTVERSGVVERAIDPALDADSEIGAHRYVGYRITITP